MLLRMTLVCLMIKDYYIKATFKLGSDEHNTSGNFKLKLDLSENQFYIEDSIGAFVTDYYPEDVYGLVVDFMIEC